VVSYWQNDDVAAIHVHLDPALLGIIQRPAPKKQTAGTTEDGIAFMGHRMEVVSAVCLEDAALHPVVLF